jgi:hypothetical protein
MSDGVARLSVVSGFAASLLVCLLGLLSLPPAAAAWSAANLDVVSHGTQRFWNYDFEAAVVDGDGCDWPVTIVFWGNASVAKVKQALGSKLPSFGNQMYLCVTPDGRRKRCAMGWASDRGIKTLSFTRALHVRLYADADGSLTSADWGSYVLATTHLDLNELSINPTYGYSEQAAAEIEALCAGVYGADVVAPDSFDLRNAEPDRTETLSNTKGGVDAHVWQCDGMATLVYVP